MSLCGSKTVEATKAEVLGDAEFSEFFRVHVAARTGAEKHDVLQAGALARDIGR